MAEGSIALLIQQLLSRVFKIVAAVVVVLMVSLYLFSSYAAVVNQAGIVRGGSQRVVKLVLAGADASQVISNVEGVMKDLKGAILLGSFSSERDKVEAFWQSDVLPAIAEFRQTQNSAKLLTSSEQLFTLTNSMVSAAQTMVHVMAWVLNVMLIGFAAAVWMFLKKVSGTFQERVVEPIATLDESVKRLAMGNLTQKLAYGRDDEIGQLCELLDKMRVNLSGYVQDIEKNLRSMAAGDLVTTTNMKYIGDYAPIQDNIEHIREALCREMQSMGEIAEKVSDSASEVSQVAQSLAEGAMNQTDSIQQLQNKITETMQQNEQVETFVEEALRSDEETKKSIAMGIHRMDKMVKAMQRINQSSEEIKSILGVLDDITAQTSLLSLNASIEAARAGEAGRGFAVVADEVRKLAEQSAQSTQNIQELINNAIAEIESGTGVVNRASGSLEEVSHSTEAVTKIINQLSAQSKNQLQQMKAVNDLSQTILGVVTDNSAVSEECAAASSELSDYSSAFKSSVGKFKTA